MKLKLGYLGDVDRVEESLLGLLRNYLELD
jgi:hypothetical protein